MLVRKVLVMSWVRITVLRWTQKWGPAVVQATDMSSIHETFAVSPYIERDVHLGLDVLTSCRITHIYAAYMHA